MTQPTNLISGRIIARNTTINFIGRVIPIIIAIATTPYVVHKLGADRFGILALAWVVIAYFTLFDMGLGRATTKFVAETLGKGEEDRVPTIFWTPMLFVLFLSCFSFSIFFLGSPLLVDHVLNIPDHLTAEAKYVFQVLSISIILTILITNFSGVLQAYQRFDLINLIRVPSQILTFTIPAIVLYFSGSLPLIVTILVMKTAVVLVFHLAFCFKVMPRAGISFDLKIAPTLFSFGGWVTLLNFAVIIFMYLDRFFIGTYLTLDDVTYYTVPNEMANKATIVPSSIMAVLFPAFSSLSSVGKNQIEALFAQAFKYLLFIIGFLIGGLVVFSKDILLIWIGEEFAAWAGLMQLFSIAVLFGAIAWLGGTVLQGVGHPKDVAVIDILQLPIYAIYLWLFTINWGLYRAAREESNDLSLSAQGVENRSAPSGLGNGYHVYPHGQRLSVSFG